MKYRFMLLCRVRQVLHELRIFVYIFGMSIQTQKANGALFHPALQIFDHLPDLSFFVKNNRSEFIHANAAFVEMIGAKSLAEILGKTDHDFSPEELADRFVRDDRQVMRSGKPITSRVELVPNSDGSISWHMTTKIPLRDGRGNITGLAGITRDLNRTATTAVRYKSMAGVIRHLETHYPEPLSVGAMAELAHLSLSQFERRFKTLFQVTPLQYLIRLRLNKASHLLSTTAEKITNIAAQCGFYDHSHFIRQFSKIFGISPSTYRHQHQ